MATQYNTMDSVLPNGMVALNSTLGQQMLNAGPTIVEKNEMMINYFKAQVWRTFCGPASLALLINGINSAYRIKMSGFVYDSPEYKRLEEKVENGEELLIDENEVVNLKEIDGYVKEKNVKVDGISLEDLGYIAMKIGFGVNTFFADDGSLRLNADKENYLVNILKSDKRTFRTVDEFRAFISDFFHRPVQGLICNYDMASLGFKEYFGHHSPLAAYHKDTDSVLILDVWPDTQPHWVKTELLFKAMATVDSSTGLPRGLLHIHELL